MKKTISLVLILLATSALTSCKKDKGGDIRDSYVAPYNVSETWTENNKTLNKPVFTMPVIKSSQFINMVLLTNFANYGAGITAEALVSGKSLTIPQQTLPNLKEITGTGTLTDTSLNIIYTETYNDLSIEVTAIAKKK